MDVNPLNAELNPICPLLSLFGAHHILHLSRKVLMLRSGIKTQVKSARRYFKCLFHLTNRLKKSNEMQHYAGIYLLLNYSTRFGRPSRPSSRVHKTVVAASGTDHTIWGASFFKPYLVTLEEACSPDSIICTRGCNYSFMYSWWWARWTPETCTVIWQ